MDAANLLRQQQQQQMNSGLMRYRSAPSSLIATLMEDDDDGDTEGCDDFIPSSHHHHHHHHHHHRSSSPEAESMFARFMNCGGGAAAADLASPDLGDKFPHFINTTIEQKFNPPPPMMYQTPPPEEDPYNSNSNSNSVPPQVKMSTATTPSPSSASNLIRHSSSPAGLFSHLSVQNGYGVMRGIGNPRVGNGTTNGGEVIGGRLKNQINLSSATPSSSGLMSQISEIESNEDGASLGNGNTSSNRYIPNFPIASWDDSALENFSGLKRPRDVVNNNNNNNNKKMIPSSSETQNGNRAPSLTHHYSLPKNSAEMAAILQFQDSVPCKIRAKRGCATHPRSIAERVRRTRISERMRKLQELVPNMDKQTNTADMLDLAVEYIKDLQKQVKTLNDVRANCTCSGKQKPY